MKNSINQVIHTLKLFPGLNEKQLVQITWNTDRTKKHADLIRRGLEKGKIHRIKAYSGGKKMFIYFVKCESNKLDMLYN